MRKGQSFAVENADPAAQVVLAVEDVFGADSIEGKKEEIEGSIFSMPDSSSNALAMTACLSAVAAVSHRAPTTVLQPALVDKQPPAAAIVLALPYFVRPCSGHQLRG
jgi:hypothetical protein